MIYRVVIKSSHGPSVFRAINQKKLQKTSLNLSINWKLDEFTNLIFIYFWNSVSSNFARKKNWLQICKSHHILVSLSANSTLRITSKLKIDLGSPIFWVDKKKIEGITIWTLTYLYNGDNSYTKSHLTYSMRAITTRSWFETARNY